MKHYDVIIAIDPDVNKSGVCYFEIKTKKIEVSALTFPELMDYLRFVKNAIENHVPANPSSLVVVEAGYLNKSNWHTKSGFNSAKTAKIGNSTGRNHETGRKIIEMAKHYGFEVVEARPLKKLWKGSDGKITQSELDNLMIKSGLGKLDKRVSQDARDSVLLSLVHSGIKLKM